MLGELGSKVASRRREDLFRGLVLLQQRVFIMTRLGAKFNG